MNQEQIVQNYWNAIPPPIGKCPSCQTEILASHEYASCSVCREPLPYRINRERRPIMYGTIKVTPANLRAQTASATEH